MKQISFFLLFIAFLISTSQSTIAQNEALNDYVPPPLFAPTKTPPPKIKKDRELKLPPLSKAVPKTAEDNQDYGLNKDSPLVKSRVFKKPKDEPSEVKPFYDNDVVKNKEPNAVKVTPKVPKPKPVIKQQPLTVGNTPPEKNLVKPGLEPIDLLKKKDIPKLERPKVQPTVEKIIKEPKPPAIEPITIQKKGTSEGVVKGPKTMPSNKKKAVETEVTFDENSAPKVNILKRSQNDIEPKKKKLEAVNNSSKAIKIPSFTKEKDGSRKIVMVFNGATEILSEQHIALLDQAIIPELDKNTDVRLILKAYAMPMDGVLASDRRIALSRAMNVRKHLLEQEIDADRIDVKSMGMHGSTQPMDRLEVFLVQ